MPSHDHAKRKDPSHAETEILEVTPSKIITTTTTTVIATIVIVLISHVSHRVGNQKSTEQATTHTESGRTGGSHAA